MNDYIYFWLWTQNERPRLPFCLGNKGGGQLVDLFNQNSYHSSFIFIIHIHHCLIIRSNITSFSSSSSSILVLATYNSLNFPCKFFYALILKISDFFLFSQFNCTHWKKIHFVLMLKFLILTNICVNYWIFVYCVSCGWQFFLGWSYWVIVNLQNCIVPCLWSVIFFSVLLFLLQ